ncbi:MAG: TAXI family TRAP transporter solute-binding subunit [Vicinamibacterales bacterium]
MRLPCAALVAFASFACSSEAPEIPVVEEVVVQLRLGTGRAGTSAAAAGERIATILNAQTDQSWSVSVESTGGSAENIRKLARGELAFALAKSAVSNAAQAGAAGWERPYSLRTIITLESEIVALVARPGSGIRDVAGVAGKAVVTSPAGGGVDDIVDAILAAHGVAGDDFTPLNATTPAAIEMLADGSASAAFMALTNAELQEEAVESGSVLVPFDDTALGSLIADRPGLQRATIAANTFDGQTADAPALDIGPVQVITSADQDVDLVYRITRFLYEARDQLTPGFNGGGMGGLDAVRSAGIEFHPGAIQYYREIGVWRE